MSDLPLPQPDRRIIGNSSNSFNQLKNNLSNAKRESNENQNTNNILYDSTEASSLSLIKLKQIEDMRQKILNYNLLTEQQTIFFSTPSNSS